LRSGIIWHTQGSGKSLTMMFMVREMYRHPKLCHWKVVFVTDRTQLEQQLGETGQAIGFNVKVADSIKTLKELLRSDSSDLVMAMIHKFREADLSETFPQLNTSPAILLMVDEAHRTQYNVLGSNLDKAVPYATRIGYTGTPIDKTEKVFGDYIDKYTMRQANEDGVTLEIIYEGRTHNAEVTDQSKMDEAFADVFSDYNLQQRLEILGYGSRTAYLEAEPTIAAKAWDMVTHYVEHVFPNGYKAQVVTTSREAAVRYQKAIGVALKNLREQLEQANPLNVDLIRLGKLKTDGVISGSHNDLPHIKAFTDSRRHEQSIKSFKLPFDGEDEGVTGEVGLLIVTDMLLTGFDAPIEQVMYLDKVIVAHNLLQAITRVNRVAESTKEKGFIVDYVGIGHHLKKALDNYDEKEQKEMLDTLNFPDDELRLLQAHYQAMLDLLGNYGLKDLNDHDAFYDLFYDEDIRFEFMLAFQAMTRSLNLVFPAKEALEYLPTYEALAEINVLAASHLNDQRLSLKGIPPKLRALTDVYLASKGIDLKVKPISILDDNFANHTHQHKRSKTKAAAVEHAIRHHLDIELDDDPELKASFAEALAAIFKDFKDNWEKIYQELEKLRQRIKDAENEPTYGLHKKKHMPFFRMFQTELGKAWEKHADYADKPDERISLLVNLTQQVYLAVERELRLTGFWESIPARNKLKADILEILLSEAFVKLPEVVSSRQVILSRIMEIAEKNNDRILYAV
jgi:type I restriction enzyme R subunit